MLVAPPKNLTISGTEIGWFEIMACRAIRGLDIEKYSVRFQTDSTAVSCPATVASVADPKKQSCFPECIKESSGSYFYLVASQTEAQHWGIATSPKSRGSTKKWWRNGHGKEPREVTVAGSLDPWCRGEAAGLQIATTRPGLA
ncbi:hypothetical protein DFH09DRAFT_1094790 [Mycena vulgaris]|nr:hypothetical protein DFH09DRAFT_1094790 [Mycena vulgaris]